MTEPSNSLCRSHSRCAWRARPSTRPVRPRALLDAASDQLMQALAELRELARGIHPAILTDQGLRAAVEALARRSPVPVELSIKTRRRAFRAQVEAASYYVISEALTNTAKYADAQTVRVSVRRNDAQLHVEVAHDGRGGADRELGSGLNRLADRVRALGGQLRVISPAGCGTTAHRGSADRGDVGRGPACGGEPDAGVTTAIRSDRPAASRPADRRPRSACRRKRGRSGGGSRAVGAGVASRSPRRILIATHVVDDGHATSLCPPGSRIAAGKTPDLHSHLTTCTGRSTAPLGAPRGRGQCCARAICSYSAAACSALSGSNHSGFGYPLSRSAVARASASKPLRRCSTVGPEVVQ